jgi:hypothetical protein
MSCFYYEGSLMKKTCEVKNKKRGGLLYALELSSRPVGRNSMMINSILCHNRDSEFLIFTLFEGDNIV